MGWFKRVKKERVDRYYYPADGDNRAIGGDAELVKRIEELERKAHRQVAPFTYIQIHFAFNESAFKYFK